MARNSLASGRPAARAAPPFLRCIRVEGTAFLLAVTLALAPGAALAREINVYAAVSLTEALTELGARFEKETGTRVHFNFGGSNVLALQIHEGAPADLFLSADEGRMDMLQKEGRLAPGTRRDILANTLVIVVARDSPLHVVGPDDLRQSAIRHIAIADPALVPAGIYARSFLSSRKLWDRVKSRILPAENVRAALAAVESGDADVGIVYRTDAGVSSRVRTAFEVPREEGPRIVYPVAVLRESRSPEDALAFRDYLFSAPALEVFTRRGFRPAAPAGGGAGKSPKSCYIN